MKRIILSIIIIAAIITGSSRVYAADGEKKVTSISVAYSGGSLLVGSEYKVEDIVVTASYDDNSTETVTEYSTNNKKVTRDGENTFTVVYKGKVSTFTITGKTVMEISASYSGDSHSVGNKINSKDVTVQVTYSDYSTDTLEEGYTLAQTTISKIGDNEVIVTYSGKRATFTVTGTEAKVVDSVYAAYTGTSKVQGGAIQPEDVMLTALYKDGTSEIIYNFTLNPSTVRNIGANTITVTFKGKSTTISVEGAQKVISSITAKYSGGSVSVGRSVKLSDITVTATYNDGTKGNESDFDIIGGGRITVVGSNLFTINAQGQRADITVTGVEASATDFASAPSYSITNSRRTGTVAIDIPSEYTAEGIVVDSLDSAVVKRMLTREIRDGDYIPFTITLVDLDLDLELPLTVQVTLPSDYNVNGCSVYFTPNKKTVIARMNTEVIDAQHLQFTMFHEGTYILSYNFEWNQQ